MDVSHQPLRNHRRYVSEIGQLGGFCRLCHCKHDSSAECIDRGEYLDKHLAWHRLRGHHFEQGWHIGVQCNAGGELHHGDQHGNGCHRLVGAGRLV